MYMLGSDCQGVLDARKTLYGVCGLVLFAIRAHAVDLNTVSSTAPYGSQAIALVLIMPCTVGRQAWNNLIFNELQSRTLLSR